MNPPRRKLIEPLSDLLQKFRPVAWQEFYPKDAEKIQVHHIVSKFALAYEKIRNIIDYKEEHLLRRNAVERMLKRRLAFSRRGQEIAKPLVYELIRAHYLDNNKLPISKIDEVVEIVDKYISLMDEITHYVDWPERSKINSWLIGIAATEIERKLVSHVRDDALLGCMYSLIYPELELVNVQLDEREKNTQIYVAAHRTLLKSDNAIISYHLLKIYYPDWPEASEKLIKEVAQNIQSIKKAIDKQLYHPLAESFSRLLKNQAVHFSILRDVIIKNPSTAFQRIADSEQLKADVQEVCKKRYTKSATRLGRAVGRSVLYILITKIFLGIMLEIPYEIFVLNSINPIPLGINVVFHPLLMLFIAVTISVPSKKNTEKILQDIKEIVYGQKREKILFKIRKSSQRGTFSYKIYNLFYLVMFLITFGLIVTILSRLNFNIISGLLFLLFLSIISFFGFRIRQSARELVVLPARPSLFSFVADFLAIPVLRVGRWISLKSSKVNIFIFIFDFIIEAPFKLILEVLEELTSFVREKKEEIH